MKVKELIVDLEKFDPDMLVVIPDAWGAGGFDDTDDVTTEQVFDWGRHGSPSGRYDIPTTSGQHPHNEQHPDKPIFSVVVIR